MTNYIKLFSYYTDTFNFTNYIFPTSVNKAEIMDLCTDEVNEFDSLLFLSTEGNGGTHLMYATLHSLIKNGEGYVNITGDDYFQLLKNNPSTFIEEYSNYKYFIFDNIEVGCSDSQIFKWLQEAYALLQLHNKKILSTFTKFEIVELEIPLFIKNNRYKTFYCLYDPTIYLEISKLYFANMGYTISEEKLNDVINYSNSSVREMLGICTSKIANYLFNK